MAGWSEVPGTLLVANNGIAVSDDGKQLFVTTWGDGKLHILSRGEIPHTRQTIDLSGLRPDNIRMLADGSLLIAAQAAKSAEVFECLREPVCTVGFVVLRFDPNTQALERQLEEPGSPDFGGASAAIVVGDEIWMHLPRRSRGPLPVAAVSTHPSTERCVRRSRRFIPQRAALRSRFRRRQWPLGG